MLSNMRVIVMASQKGGSGKTTLAGHLAVEADRSGHGPVALIDTDPQGSLAQWWNAREPDGPAFVQSTIHTLKRRRDEDRRTLHSDLVGLREQGFRLVVIDTPPSVTRTIAEVVSFADLVILPTRPSPHDLRAVGATVDILEDRGKAMVFVINGATPRARITGDAAVALSQHGTVAPITIHHRVDFASSMIDGRTVMEVNPESKSAKEIAALWTYIHERLRRKHIVALPGGVEDPAASPAVVAIPSPILPAGLRPAQPFGRRSVDKVEGATTELGSELKAKGVWS
jgi:chromosome partitioning protein